MDGAIIGNQAVLFEADVAAAFIGTTYTVPSTVNEHYLTGCVPGALYAVTAANTPSGSLITVIPASSGLQADPAGVLTFNF
jgi:hypothetical protein